MHVFPHFNNKRVSGLFCTYYLIPRTYHLIPRTYHLIPRTYHLIPRTYHLMPRTYHLIPRTYYLISRTNHLITHTYHLIPRTHDQLLFPFSCNLHLLVVTLLKLKRNKHEELVKMVSYMFTTSLHEFQL